MLVVILRGVEMEREREHHVYLFGNGFSLILGGQRSCR